jgi:hypothetical protein
MSTTVEPSNRLVLDTTNFDEGIYRILSVKNLYLTVDKAWTEGRQLKVPPENGNKLDKTEYATLKAAEIIKEGVCVVDIRYTFFVESIHILMNALWKQTEAPDGTGKIMRIFLHSAKKEKSDSWVAQHIFQHKPSLRKMKMCFWADAYYNGESRANSAGFVKRKEEFDEEDKYINASVDDVAYSGSDIRENAEALRLFGKVGHIVVPFISVTAFLLLLAWGRNPAKGNFNYAFQWLYEYDDGPRSPVFEVSKIPQHLLEPRIMRVLRMSYEDLFGHGAKDSCWSPTVCNDWTSAIIKQLVGQKVLRRIKPPEMASITTKSRFCTVFHFTCLLPTDTMMVSNRQLSRPILTQWKIADEHSLGHNKELFEKSVENNQKEPVYRSSWIPVKRSRDES